MANIVSIIVPIYNVGQYLPKCIESIINQTYADLDIILVDDGSTDESSQICDDYRKKDSRIIVIHKQNEGLVKARKTGLENASGRYICYVDGDDWIEPDMIECLLADMDAADADLVVSNLFYDFECVSQKTQSILDVGVYNTKEIIPKMLYTGEFYEFGISQFACSKIFLRDILMDIQMNVDDRIKCGEDVAVTYPYILQTQKVYISDYTGYHYMQRIGSMAGSYDPDEFVRNKILIKYLQKVFENSSYSKVLYDQLNQYAKNLLLTRYISFFDSLQDGDILIPYGGISIDSRIVIYGAGKMGQSVYRYLKTVKLIEIVDWFDKNFIVYQKMDKEIRNPVYLKNLSEDEYDIILIAVNSQNAIRSIRSYLENEGINTDKIRCLNDNFISEKNYILDRLLLKDRELFEGETF